MEAPSFRAQQRRLHARHPWLVATLISLLLQMPAMTWEEGDRQAYNNKMALLKVLVDAAKDRATLSGDLETLFILMSIGNDVTLR